MRNGLTAPRNPEHHMWCSGFRLYEVEDYALCRDKQSDYFRNNNPVSYCSDFIHFS